MQKKSKKANFYKNLGKHEQNKYNNLKLTKLQLHKNTIPHIQKKQTNKQTNKETKKV